MKKQKKFLIGLAALMFSAFAASAAEISVSDGGAISAVRATVGGLPDAFHAPIAQFLNDPNLSLQQLDGVLRGLPRGEASAAAQANAAPADLGEAAVVTGADRELAAHRLWELDLALGRYLSDAQRAPLTAAAKAASDALGEEKSRAIERKMKAMAFALGQPEALSEEGLGAPAVIEGAHQESRLPAVALEKSGREEPARPAVEKGTSIRLRQPSRTGSPALYSALRGLTFGGSLMAATGLFQIIFSILIGGLNSSDQRVVPIAAVLIVPLAVFWYWGMKAGMRAARSVWFGQLTQGPQKDAGLLSRTAGTLEVLLNWYRRHWFGAGAMAGGLGTGVGLLFLVSDRLAGIGVVPGIGNAALAGFAGVSFTAFCLSTISVGLGWMVWLSFRLELAAIRGIIAAWSWAKSR